MQLALVFLAGMAAVPILRALHVVFWHRRDDPPVKIGKERMEMFSATNGREKEYH